jgi:hypothetical protein
MERGPLFEDEDEMEEVWKKAYPIQPEIAPDKFKTVEELQASLDRALGGKSGVAKTAEEDEIPFDTDEDEEVKPAKKAKEVVAKAPPAKKAKPAPKKVEEDEDENISDFLDNLDDED